VAAPLVSAPAETVEPADAGEPFADVEPFGAASTADNDPEPEPVFDLGPRRRRSKSKSKNSSSTAQLAVVPAPAVISAADPLSTTIQEILDGWGELTPEDMKRLELFRPDALNAALAAVELPKSKSEDAKVRLTQMRQYGIGLERRAEAMHPTGPSATAAAVTTAAAVVATTPATATAPPATTAPAALYVTGAARAQVMTPGSPAPSFSPIVAPLTAPASRSFYDAEPVDVAPQREEEKPATEALAEVAPAAVAPTAPLEEVEAETVSRAPLDEMESLWAEPRPVWEPDPEPAFEEMPAPMFAEVEMELAPTQGVPLDTSALSAALNVPMGMPDRETPTLPAEPVEELMDAAPEDEAPSVSKSPLDDDLFWEDELPAMSRLSEKVETAEQLMALPTEDRADMTAFLPPTELAAAFRASQDPGLKRAVIDTLENIGTPASLNALGNCFEDADPEIQAYALAAADRLLGVV